MRELFDDLPDDLKEMLNHDAVSRYVYERAVSESWTRQHFAERLAVELFRVKEAIMRELIKQKQMQPFVVPMDPPPGETPR